MSTCSEGLNSVKAAPSATSQLPSKSCLRWVAGKAFKICSYLPSSENYGLYSKRAGITLRLKPSPPIKLVLGGAGFIYLFLTQCTG